MFKIISDKFSPDDLDRLLEDLGANRLVCAATSQKNGDKRYWDVCKNTYGVVAEFDSLARDMFEQEMKRQPKNLVVMINQINAVESPDGSGGGWHVDSVRNQYKLFVYLTDCKEISYGPLTLLTTGRRILDKFVIAINYIIGNKFRFSEGVIQLLSKIGFKSKPVLLPKNKPFWVNTSFIHRGAEISQGERIMMTAYIYDGEIPSSIQGRINGV